MKAHIIFYDISQLSAAKKEKVLTALWGKQQQSYYGKYKYRIGGILDKIPHTKPAKSAVIIKSTDHPKIIKLFKKHGVKSTTFKTTVKKKVLKPQVVY